jgi:hypothetical protein
MAAQPERQRAGRADWYILTIPARFLKVPATV